MTPLETIERDGWTCSLYQDENAMSPDEWDNLGTLIHSTDYTFGESMSEPARGWNVYIRALRIFGDDVAAVLPVYIAEHGPQLSCWESDAESANAALVTTHARLSELAGSEDQYHAPEWALDALRGELEVWRQYLEGDVYGCVVRDETDEVHDSLWGLYGWQYAQEEAERELAEAIQHEHEQAQAISQ